MNTGVEILLKRMADCPEDFYYDHNKGESRWARLVDNAIAGEIATQEERELLEAGMKEVRRQKFTEMVMKELAGVEDEPSEVGKYPTSNIGMGGVTLASTTQSPYLSTNGTTGTVTLPSGSITLGNTTLNEEQLKHMKAHVEALQQEYANVFKEPKVEVNKKPLIKRIFK